MRTIMRRALTPLALLMLAACGGDDDKAGADGTARPEASSRTLAATLQGADGYGSLSRAVGNAGLTGVLEGVGPYTLFAPADAAFTTAGAPDFADESLRAESAALLRAHIVPGALTRSDIAAALQRDSDGKVQMRTMAGTMLTFSRDGDGITVSSDSGASGRLGGEETVASNGVLQPVDALLVKAEAPAAR
jgi:uncharacterized surface protein with fasciclin (FAS1) repeats